jgi:flagellar biosynthesis protein FlhF
MNLKRFTARTSREALALVKAAFGDDAIVMSTKPCEEGVEVLAMASDSVEQLERMGQAAETVTMRSQTQAPPRAPAHNFEPLPTPRAPTLRERTAPAKPRMLDRLTGQAHEAETRAVRTEPPMDAAVQADVAQMEMSTLSFQDYVRDRMLKRRSAEMAAAAPPEPALPTPLPPEVAPIEAARARIAARREVPVLRDEVTLSTAPAVASASAFAAAPAARTAAPSGPAPTPPNAGGEQIEVMSELRSMRGLIEQRFGALAFMEKLQRQPRQANLAKSLLDAGFSPMLIRKLVESLPAEGDETMWAASVLERNVVTAEHDAPLEDQGGIHALIGATGVGKTTSTAKLAAAFATRHGAPHLGLITLDAYRVGAHEQLRAYGRILGVPVHTAHDRDSLEDLLDLLSGKRMVLIDTAGMAQRDSRTRELLDMLTHSAINRVLVVNASAQGETIEDQLAAYNANSCKGLILSKLDEAVKLGPALDSMIRHKLKVLAVANGQRVPEDWHRLSAQALVQRALKGGGGAAWQLDDRDVNLIFAGLPPMVASVSTATAAAVNAELHA